MKTFFRQIVLIPAALGLALLPARAQVAPAATPPAANPTAVAASYGDTDNFTIRLGAFFLSSIRTTLSLTDSAGKGGQELDFKKDLGGSDSLNVFRADSEWRFAARHKVQLAYFDLNRNASRVIDKQISWGDQTYPVNTTINTQFRSTVYKLNYGYALYRNDTNTQEICGLIGFHISAFKTSLSSATSGKAEGVSVTAPLPVFGLEWKARLTDQLTSFVSYQYFGLTLDSKYQGNLSDFQALLDYSLGGNWNVGAGYNRFTTRASVKGDNLKLTFRHNYNGLMLFVSTSF